MGDILLHSRDCEEKVPGKDFKSKKKEYLHLWPRFLNSQMRMYSCTIDQSILIILTIAWISFILIFVYCYSIFVFS